MEQVRVTFDSGEIARVVNIKAAADTEICNAAMLVLFKFSL